MDVQQMLEHRYSTLLQWADHWPALDAELGSFSACVHSFATVHHCIGIARQAAADMGRQPSVDDREALLDFIATMWAEPLTEGTLAKYSELRELCAAAYQVVGVADGPVEVLNNLSAAASGSPLPHDPMAGLPWPSTSTGVK